MKSIWVQWSRIWSLPFLERCSVCNSILVAESVIYCIILFPLGVCNQLSFYCRFNLFDLAPYLRNFKWELMENNDPKSIIPSQSKHRLVSWIQLVAISLLNRICGVAWSIWKTWNMNDNTSRDWQTIYALPKVRFGVYMKYQHNTTRLSA